MRISPMMEDDCSMLDTIHSEDNCVPASTPLSDWSSSSGYSECARHPEISSFAIPGEVSGPSCDDLPATAQKHVSFGDLEIRKYPVILGDHPDCTMGPPITIDWEYFKTRLSSIDEYESQRGERRDRDGLHLSWIQRKQVLRKNVGASDEAMRQAAFDAQNVRIQRQRTLRLRPFEFVEVRLESLKRKAKRVAARRP